MNPALAARVRQLQAEAEHRRAIREFRARREADERARAGALLNELIAALAGLVDGGACITCISCRRALSPRRRNCPYCGTRDARSAPVAPEQAEQNRGVLAEVLKGAAGRDAA